MPTPSETKFLNAGRNNKFSVTNWEAMTGIGRFDAVYSPQAGKLDVTVKVFIEYRDFDQKWSDNDKQKWGPRALWVVEDFWSNRFIFECARPDWEKKYRAEVKLRCVETTKANAHLHLVVDKRSPDAGTMGGGVSFSKKPPFCLIDNLAIEPKDQRKVREGIFNLRLFMIEQGLQDLRVAVIHFAANSDDIPGQMKLRLGDYARHVHRIATSDVVGIQLYVYGGKGAGDGTFQIGLGMRRAKAVKEVLDRVIRNDNEVVATDSPNKKSGLRAKILEALTVHAGHAVASTQFQGAVIVTHVPSTVDRAAERNYIVLCHEFGHMLGLPDEYMGRLHPGLTARANTDSLISTTLQLATKSGDPANWDDETKRRAEQQAAMAEMLRQNPTVKAPAYLDQNQILGNIQVSSSSIMYGGMEVMPAHYLTLWQCLAEMTWGFVNPAHWKILPSTNYVSGMRYF